MSGPAAGCNEASARVRANRFASRVSGSLRLCCSSAWTEVTRSVMSSTWRSTVRVPVPEPDGVIVTSAQRSEPSGRMSRVLSLTGASSTRTRRMACSVAVQSSAWVRVR